jgi:hypothetical protein
LSDQSGVSNQGRKRVITKADRASLYRLHLLLGKSLNTTKKLMESLAIFVLLEHAEGRSVNIPYLGELTMTYRGEELTKAGKRAKVETQLVPSDFLVRNIGQLQDGDLTDAERLLMERVQEIFSSMEKGTFQTAGELDE